MHYQPGDDIKPIRAQPGNPSTNHKEVSSSVESPIGTAQKKKDADLGSKGCVWVGQGKVGKGGNVAGQQKEEEEGFFSPSQ